MEINKDPAMECFARGKTFFRKGEYEKASKMFKKSKRLFPLPDIDVYINLAESKLTSTESKKSKVHLY